MMEEDVENQENELLALESIYEKRQFERAIEDKGGEINIYLDIPSPFLILLPLRQQNSLQEDKGIADNGLHEIVANRQQRLTEITVNYLPPVVLNFRFPANYPSERPPSFTLSCKWLSNSQLSTVCGHLDQIWIENGPGSVILFQWVQFLTDEIISVLKIETPFQLQQVSQSNFAAGEDIDERAVQDIASTASLVRFLLEYDRIEKQRVFRLTYFTCNVCLMGKPGSKCVSFYPCDHVYCSECMAEYFKVRITEGGVNALTCPNDKCDSQANPSQIKQLVDSEIYEKYEKYMLQTTLDCMSDVIYCPRKICQSPVIVEDDTMGMCPKCSLAFCIICKRSYHGISPCPMNESEFQNLRKEYSKASAEKRAEMEKKYGSKRLKYFLEDAISEQWLKNNAKKCPYCRANIEKSEGCNKMTCFKCHNNFCWLCLEKINKSNPYLHFNSKGSKCYQKLFEGTVLPEFEIEFDDDFF